MANMHKFKDQGQSKSWDGTAGAASAVAEQSLRSIQLGGWRPLLLAAM